MPRSAAALCRIAATVPTPSSTPDAQLLRAFLASGTDDAFTELVRRHGPMVLAACRRVLSDAHDAEDAFQATFLVLARKAGSMRGTNVAGWLHAVAVRTARGVRLTRDRRRKRDLASGECQRSGGRQPPVSPEAPDHDTAAVIDEELAKLPDYYRDAVVLCELRGLSRKDAAAELGIREGTLSSRLAAAKRKLAARLSARGLAGVVLATALAPAAVAAYLIEATTVAVRGAAGSAASAAASTVLKGMLFDQLRSTALVAVLVAGVCGALAMTGTPAADESGKAAAPMPDPAAKLVEQLGSADFATREAAEKALKELGMKAEAALRAGLKSDDPEVRARSAAVLKHVREAELKAFVAGKVEPASPAWKRFKELLGDTNASRKLFAEMMADDRRAQTVEKAEANPAKAVEVYAAEVTRLAEVGKKAWDQIVNERPSRRAAPGFPNPHGPALREAITPGDVVAVLFLGTRPLPVGAKDPSTELVLLTSFADGVVGPHKEPFRKLFAAWFDQRRDAKAVEAGLNAALFTGVAEALPTARRLAGDGKLPASAKGSVLLIIGNHGTAADDLPLLSAHRDDTRLSHDGTAAGQPDIKEEVRDVACVMSLLLRGEDVTKYGFGFSGIHVWWLPVNPSTNKAASSYFKTDEDRAAAHKKAWEWLDAQPKPEKPPAKGAEFWPRFTKLIGDDKPARELFNLIVSEPKNLELFAKAEKLLKKADAPDATPEDLFALERLYLARRDELNTLADAGTFSRPAVYGWIYLGTYPRTDHPGRLTRPLEFMPDHYTPAKDRTGVVRYVTGPNGAAARRLVLAWADRQLHNDNCLRGLELALGCGFQEGVGLARRVLAESARLRPEDASAPRVGTALLLVGRYGAETDLPTVAKFLNSTKAIHVHQPGGPAAEFVEGKGVANQIRDTAAVVMIVLRKGKPEDFGFIWTKTEAAKLVPWANKLGTDPLDVQIIGFSTEADRTAAHKKAKEWLDKQKDAPKKEPAGK